MKSVGRMVEIVFHCSAIVITCHIKDFLIRFSGEASLNVINGLTGFPLPVTALSRQESDSFVATVKTIDGD